MANDIPKSRQLASTVGQLSQVCVIKDDWSTVNCVETLDSLNGGKDGAPVVAQRMGYCSSTLFFYHSFVIELQ